MVNQSYVRALAERASDTVRRITAGTTTWRSIGLTRFVPWYLSQLAKGFGMSERACIQLVTGDTSAAVNQLKLGTTTLCSTGATLFVPWLQSNLARAYGDLGELDDARRCIDEATTTMRTSNQRWCEAETNRIAGDIVLLSPKRDTARAEAYFERALSVARQQQAKSWQLRAAMSLARLWRDQGKVQQARELLGPVYEWFTEGFDTRDLKEAKALLEELAA